MNQREAAMSIRREDSHVLRQPVGNQQQHIAGLHGCLRQARHVAVSAPHKLGAIGNLGIHQVEIRRHQTERSSSTYHDAQTINTDAGKSAAMQEWRSDTSAGISNNVSASSHRLYVGRRHQIIESLAVRLAAEVEHVVELVAAILFAPLAAADDCGVRVADFDCAKHG
jgi:hypothetical protein